MKVAEAVGKALAGAGIGQIFGVVGSGNFRVTNAMVGEGVPFIASRHETGAAIMADAYTRMSGRTAVVSVHQGPGFTNALTGLTEAAKSHTPMLVLAPHAPNSLKASNFWIDQSAIAEGAGCVVEQLRSPATAVQDALGALDRARRERCTVVLVMPNEIQEDDYQGIMAASPVRSDGSIAAAPASSDDVAQLVRLLAGSTRPVFIAGRGALAARDELIELAESCGALLATSAVARGLFAGDPWNLDVSGGFATPAATALIAGADLLVVWGASLNRWTTSNGALLTGAKTVVQVDDRADALGLHYPVDVGIVADVPETARRLSEAWAATGESGNRYRTPEVTAQLEASGDWRLVQYDETAAADKIDPRTLTIGLDAVLPMDRIVVPDGGNFNGYPAMFFRVPDQHGYCLPLAFASIGLGLSAAIGAATALPERTAIAGVGDGGFLMSLVELDTAVRLRLGIVVVVYNDDAYGAEVHHFGPEGVPLEIVQFPPTDIAQIARGFGCDAITVTRPEDIGKVQDWLNGARDRPLVIDAKVTSFLSWVSRHAFEGPGF